MHQINCPITHYDIILLLLLYSDMICIHLIYYFFQYIVLPPYITAFGEEGGFDDLRSHPRVRASSTHFSSLVPLSSQAKVSDLQCLPTNVIVLNSFKY